MKPARSKLSSLALGLALASSACTVVNVATVPPAGPGVPFVTTGDIAQPYDSLGLVQVTRKGAIWLGFLDINDANLHAGFNEELMPLVRSMGGDGAINVRFDQSQYLPWVRVLLFLFPLPTHVTMTAEVVRLRR